MVLIGYFEGMDQTLQLMCSSYLSKSILESAPTFSSISLITSCSSGGRRMSPRLRLKYWLRPKWRMRVVMNWSYCCGYIRFWKLVNPLANTTGFFIPIVCTCLVLAASGGIDQMQILFILLQHHGVGYLM